MNVDYMTKYIVLLLCFCNIKSYLNKEILMYVNKYLREETYPNREVRKLSCWRKFSEIY